MAPGERARPRLPLPAPLRRELERPVAAHAARAPYALGVTALLLLGLAALSGVMLALAFDPVRARALLTGPLALPRAVHAWAASAVLVVVLVHVGRVALTAAYRPPRQRTWWLGLAALAGLLALFWLGVALRGDQQAFEAWRHGALTLALFGLGAGDAALPAQALFWLHVLVVPALLVAAVALHLRRVRALDLAAPPDIGPGRGPGPGASGPEPATAKAPFLRHASAGARTAAGVAALVLLLALAAPPALGPAPIPELEAARAPWPFAWLVPLQDVLGTWGIPLGLGGLFLLLALVPRLDDGSGAPRGADGRRRVLVLLAALLTLVVGLGLWALLGPGAVRVVG